MCTFAHTYKYTYKYIHIYAYNTYTKHPYIKKVIQNIHTWKKFHDFIAEAAKAYVPYFEVLEDGFIKRPCDADLVFCS